MKRKIIIIAVIVIVLVGGFFGYRYYQQTQAAASVSSFQTSKLEKGSLIASIEGTGSVEANQSVSLSWRASGIVASFTTKLGDVVEESQVLAELEKDSLPQSVISAESDLVTNRRTLDSLIKSDLARAKAQLALATAKTDLQTALDNREAARYQRASQDTIDLAYVQYLSADNDFKDKKEAYEDVSELTDQNQTRIEALNAYALARQVRDQALYEYNYVKGMPDELEVAEVEGNLEVSKATLKDAETEWERLKDGADPADVAAAEAKVNANLATLDTAKIKAPFKGTITKVENTPGDRVTSTTDSSTVAFRIDDLSRVFVSLSITEVDINKIKVGQPVSFTFDAIPDKTYNGEVTEVSQVGTTVSSVVNFDVMTEVTDADENILPGMTSAVNIIVSQVDDVLVVPSSAIRTVNNKKVIYIIKNNVVTVVEITIGATSETNSEIATGDVSVGDTVILNPSTSTSGGMMMPMMGGGAPGGGGGPPSGGGGGGGGGGQ